MPSAKERFYLNQLKDGKINQTQFNKIMNTAPATTSKNQGDQRVQLFQKYGSDPNRRPSGQSLSDWQTQQQTKLNSQKKTVTQNGGYGRGTWNPSQGWNQMVQDANAGKAIDTTKYNLTPQEKNQADQALSQAKNTVVDQNGNGYSMQQPQLSPQDKAQADDFLSKINNAQGTLLNVSQPQLSTPEKQQADDFLAKLRAPQQSNQFTAFNQQLDDISQQQAANPVPPSPTFLQRLNGFAKGFIAPIVKGGLSVGEIPAAVSSAMGNTDKSAYGDYEKSGYNIPWLGNTTSYTTDILNMQDQVVSGKKPMSALVGAIADPVVNLGSFAVGGEGAKEVLTGKQAFFQTLKQGGSIAAAIQGVNSLEEGKSILDSTTDAIKAIPVGVLTAGALHGMFAALGAGYEALAKKGEQTGEIPPEITQAKNATESKLPSQLEKEGKTTAETTNPRAASSTLAAEKPQEKATLQGVPEKGVQPDLNGSKSYTGSTAQIDKNVKLSDKEAEIVNAKKYQSDLIDKAAKERQAMEESLSGGQLVERNASEKGYEQYGGSMNMKRISEHSKEYRDYFKQNGRKPPLSWYKDQITKEIQNGTHSASEEYKSVSDYINSLADEKTLHEGLDISKGNRAAAYIEQARKGLEPTPDRVDAPIVFKNAVVDKGNKGKSIVDAVKNIFDPVHNIVEGPQIKNAFREHVANFRYNSDVAADQSVTRTKMWDKVKPEDQLNFIHSIETGTPQKGTEELYNNYKKLFDQDYETMKSINPDAPYRKDYFTHNGLWADPKQATEFFNKWAKEQLGGNKAFMKGREFPTVYDGLKAGLKLKETNPEKLFLNNHINVMKAKMADDFTKEMEQAGMPKEAVQAVVDRYMDRGLKSNAIFQTLREANNSMNSFQLGLSAFHFTTTSVNSVTSKFAQGLKEITQGRVVKGLGHIAESPVSVFTDAIRGNKAIKEAFGNNPQLTDDVKAVLTAGGNLRQSHTYQIGAISKMLDGFKEGGIKGYAKGVLHAPFAAIQTLSHPLMEWYVPRIKVGSFLSNASSELERLGNNASHDEIRAALAKTWDSTDNRFGQLVQDNLLWNQTFKDVLNASSRSLGWNLGTVRELGGGVGDLFKKSTWKGLSNGEGITDKTAYTIALPAVTAMIATMYMKMHGQTPTTGIDLAYPRTGQKTPQGYDERVSIPGYMKDVFSYKENPAQTILNKQSPLLTVLSKLGELSLTGGIKDYYGNWVVDPYASESERAKQIAQWSVSQFKPFSVSAGTQRIDQSLEAKGESALGFQPAPAYVTKGPEVTKLSQMWRDMLPNPPKTPAEAAAFDLKMQQADPKAGKTPEEAQKELDFLTALRKTANDSPERTQLIQDYYKGLNEDQRKSLNFKMMMAGISTKGVSTSDAMIGIKPTYDQVDQLMKQGKTQEADQIINNLSPEDKKSFDSMRGRLKPSWYDPQAQKAKVQALSGDGGDISSQLYSHYQDLTKQDPQQADKFLKSMDYPTYQKFVKQRTAARAANTRQFKQFLASDSPKDAVDFIGSLDKTEQNRILGAMTPAMRQRYAEGKAQQ